LIKGKEYIEPEDKSSAAILRMTTNFKTKTRPSTNAKEQHSEQIFFFLWMLQTLGVLFVLEEYTIVVRHFWHKTILIIDPKFFANLFIQIKNLVWKKKE